MLAWSAGDPRDIDVGTVVDSLVVIGGVLAVVDLVSVYFDWARYLV